MSLVLIYQTDDGLWRQLLPSYMNMMPDSESMSVCGSHISHALLPTVIVFSPDLQ